MKLWANVRPGRIRIHIHTHHIHIQMHIVLCFEYTYCTLFPVLLVHKCRVTWNSRKTNPGTWTSWTQSRWWLFQVQGLQFVAQVPHRINGLAVGPVFTGGISKFYSLWAWNCHEGCRDICQRYGIQWPFRRHGSENFGNVHGNSSSRGHWLRSHAFGGVFGIYQWVWSVLLCWSGSVWCWL